MTYLKLSVMLLCGLAMFVAVASRIMLASWLRKRHVRVVFVWTGTPGYLESLYWKQPPDPEWSRARWLVVTATVSFISALVLFLGSVLVIASDS
jgi:hypothetical protein